MVSFSTGLISLSVMCSRSICVVTNGRISSFLMVEYYSIVYLFDPFIHWWAFGLFHILATVNNASINMGMPISCWNHMAFFESSFSPAIPVCLSSRVHPQSVFSSLSLSPPTPHHPSTWAPLIRSSQPARVVYEKRSSDQVIAFLKTPWLSMALGMKSGLLTLTYKTSQGQIPVWLWPHPVLSVPNPRSGLAHWP